jgi:hypothetical protein
VGTVGNMELAEDARDVIADCLRADYQARGDLGIAKTASD